MAITTLEQTKLILSITGTTKDALISALIPLVEADFLFIRNKAFETDDNDDIVYPDASDFTAIKMINYNLKYMKKEGLSAESLADHSATFATVDGYPNSIRRMIKKYLKTI